MSNISPAHHAANFIKNAYPDFQPHIAVILGSGLGEFATTLDRAKTINYQDIPGFPEVKVHGHHGLLTLGYLGDKGVICLQGRAHTYEGLHNYEVVKTYVRAFKLLGCEYFIATNAAGSIREDVGPGELMLITDHINFQPHNPMVGPNDDEFGERFYPLDNAYDLQMRESFLNLAKKHAINLAQGVYISVLGPNYETAAEIRAFKILGADAVGMSTVPEVLVANHCGLKVAVISIITNFATGLSQTSHSHEAVVKMAEHAAEKLNILLAAFIRDLP